MSLSRTIGQLECFEVSRKKTDPYTWTNILLFCSVIALSAVQWNGEVWRSKIFAGLVLLTLASGVIISKRLHWSIAFAFVSTIVSALSVFAFPKARYSGPSGASFDAQASEAAFYVLVLMLPFLFLRRKHLNALIEGVSWLCLLDSCFVIAQGVFGSDPMYRGGFFGNSSINACLIAFTYPFLVFRPVVRYYDPKSFESIKANPVFVLWDTFKVLAPMAAVFISGSSMAFGAMLIASEVNTLLDNRSTKGLRILSAVVLMIILSVAAYVTFGTHLVDDSDRFKMWSIAMQWWDVNANAWFGTGVGSYFLLGPHIQTLNHYREGFWWIWLHNDWLQLVFEQGIVGLASFVIVLISVVRACFKSKQYWVLSAALAYAFTSLGNYPARLMVHGLIGIFICVLAFKLPKNYKEKHEGKR
jgi:hypothetical protein